MSETYQFTIEGSYSPATLPMERLALYMGALAKLLGEQGSVHFEGVRPGSAVLVAAIDKAARPKVRERAQSVRDGTATRDARDAFFDLDTLLRKDNAVGNLVGEGGAIIIPFPGRNRAEPPVYGPFKQEGTLDGQLIRVGGRGPTIPVHLQEGEAVYTGLYTTSDIAKRLAQFYLGPVLRVQGVGIWLRSADGTWILKEFKVTDFEALDDAPLQDVISKLHRVHGSGWGQLPNPVADLLSERRGPAH